MTINLSLKPQEEALLLAAAQARGVSTDALVHEALDAILKSSRDERLSKSEPRPIWEVMLENVKDLPDAEFAMLPEDGASEHDHYLYGRVKCQS